MQHAIRTAAKQESGAKYEETDWRLLRHVRENSETENTLDAMIETVWGENSYIHCNN